MVISMRIPDIGRPFSALGALQRPVLISIIEKQFLSCLDLFLYDENLVISMKHGTIDNREIFITGLKDDPMFAVDP